MPFFALLILTSSQSNLATLRLLPHQAPVVQAKTAQATKVVSNQSLTSDLQTPTPPLPAKVISSEDPGAVILPPPSKIDPLLVKPISADQAAQIAVLRQPSLLAAKDAVRAAQGLVVQAKSGLYPSTSLTSGYSYTTRLSNFGVVNNSGGNNISGQTLSGFSNQVNLKQLIFDFGRTMDSVKQAEETKNAIFQTEIKAKNDLVFAVKQQYFITEEADQQVHVDVTNLASQKAQLDLASGLLKQGLGAPSDVVTANTNYDNSIQTLIQARNTYLLDRISLAAFIGVDPRTPIQLEQTPTTISNPSIDLAGVVKQALQNRPEVLAAQSNVKASLAGLSSAHKGLVPSFDLSLGAATRGSVDPFSSDTSSAGLTVSWPLEDGGLTQGRVEQAQALADQSVANLTSIQLSTISDVANAYANLEASIKRYASAQAGVANAEEALKLAQGRYKAGVALFTEITIAQASLSTAQSNELNDQASYEIALAQLDHAVGLPLRLHAK